MEYKVSKEKICVSSCVFSGTKEQALDVDLSLPDYCPDVRRVLKCHIAPQINSRTINGDVLEIDGTAVISVMYSDPDGCLRCYEHSMPFNCAMAIKNPPDDYIIFVNTKTDYMNCRALTPRRLDLHGAFTVFACVTAKAEKELVCSVEGKDVEQKCMEKSYSQLCGIGQQTVSITEITPLSQGKLPIQTILRKEGCVSVEDVRIVPDKAMVNGTIRVKLFYLGDIEKGITDSFEYDIPFNRIIDISGIDSDCRCHISAEVGSICVNISEDENNEIVTDLRMTLSALCYRKCKIKCVADAYSTRYDMLTRSSQISMPDTGIEINETLRAKSTVDFGDKQVTKIMDIWCELSPMTAECTAGKYIIKGKLSVNIIALTSEGEPFYTERAVELTKCVSEDEHICDIKSELYAHVLSFNYRLSGDCTLEFSADVKVRGCIFREKVTDNIVFAEADTEHEQKKDSAALILYYAHEKESLWDIAKRYKTPMKGILEENELEDCEEVDAGLLILPSF